MRGGEREGREGREGRRGRGRRKEGEERGRGGGNEGRREGGEGGKEERRDKMVVLNCYIVYCVHVIESQCCNQGNSFFPFVHEIMLVSHSSPRRAGCGLGGDHHSVARQRALCVSLRYHP